MYDEADAACSNGRCSSYDIGNLEHVDNNYIPNNNNNNNNSNNNNNIILCDVCGECIFSFVYDIGIPHHLSHNAAAAAVALVAAAAAAAAALTV